MALHYKYGNMFYVKAVSSFLNSGTLVKYADKTVQKIMDEVINYKVRAFVFWDRNPKNWFWLFRVNFARVGIKLPRTAQAQYNSKKHLNIKDAKSNDLIFFRSPYDTADYVTNVSIYVGGMKIFHAGNPISLRRKTYLLCLLLLLGSISFNIYKNFFAVNTHTRS